MACSAASRARLARASFGARTAGRGCSSNDMSGRNESRPTIRPPFNTSTDPSRTSRLRSLTDEYSSTKSRGRRMYGAGDALPGVYEERFRTQMYSERVVYPGVWNKVVVVAREDDDETMLNHALIQSRRRYREVRRTVGGSSEGGTGRTCGPCATRFSGWEIFLSDAPQELGALAWNGVERRPRRAFQIRSRPRYKRRERPIPPWRGGRGSRSPRLSRSRPWRL